MFFLECQCVRTTIAQHSGEPECRCQRPIIQLLENGYRSNVVLYEMGSLDVCSACIFDTWSWPNCSPSTSKLPTDAQNSANMSNVLSANPLDSVKPPTNCRCGLQIVVYSPFGSGSNINYPLVVCYSCISSPCEIWESRSAPSQASSPHRVEDNYLHIEMNWHVVSA